MQLELAVKQCWCVEYLHHLQLAAYSSTLRLRDIESTLQVLVMTFRFNSLGTVLNSRRSQRGTARRSIEAQISRDYSVNIFTLL